ncbi:NPDC1 protein, partial [Zosterops hypoxanthus]|nr:NPDC1 protein [Zosterops hypoxanthus]
AASCPRSLDCALQRREFCPPGSGACGPCLPPFQEDDHGHCVQKQLSPSAVPETSFPAPQAGLPSGAARALLTALSSPAATLVPEGSRQRAASGLREGHLQRGPAGTMAASILPTTATVQKYPGVEASPIPANENMVLGLIVVCTVAGISALIVAAICWYRLQKEVRLAQKADYSPQRVTSPLPYDKISPGDKTLAQSAQMYHYQHQKQQMLSLEKHKEEPKLPDSASSDEENEDGDFTVYECPGLAPTGEMEVRNPLFDDSSLHPSNPK